jgi:hypothetical protein
MKFELKTKLHYNVDKALFVTPEMPCKSLTVSDLDSMIEQLFPAETTFMSTLSLSDTSGLT